MQHDINKTSLVPYLIAEKVLHTVIEKDSRYKNLPHNARFKMVEDLTPALVIKSETLYQKSQHFRDTINKRGQDMREQLAMFMAHWSLKLIDTRCQN